MATLGDFIDIIQVAKEGMGVVKIWKFTEMLFMDGPLAKEAKRESALDNRYNLAI